LGFFGSGSEALSKVKTVKGVFDKVEIVNSNMLRIEQEGKHKLAAILRIFSSEEDEFKSEPEWQPTEILLKYKRFANLFEALYKSRIPFTYVVTLKPHAVSFFGRIFRKEANCVFEHDVVVITWVEGGSKEEEEIFALEKQTGMLEAALTVAFPKEVIERLSGSKLERAFKSLLIDLAESTLVDAKRASGELLVPSRMPPMERRQAPPAFYIPNYEESGSDGILLGRVISRGGEFHHLYISPGELKHHACILGMTGSGKSTTARVVMGHLKELGYKILVLDWHGEHGRFIRKIGGEVLAPGKSEDFTLNPLDPFYIKDVSEHVAIITDIFSEIYRFTYPQSFAFRNAVSRVYGNSVKPGSRMPTLSTLVNEIEMLPIKSAYDNETKIALLRRLLPLTEGQAGRALNGESTCRIDSLLSSVVNVELNHLRDFESRAIFASLLLKVVYDYRMFSGVQEMNHVVVVEEARGLVPARRLEDPPTIGEKMVAELRKFGEGMIFIAQFPSQISSEIIKNSGVRIAHRTSWLDDVKLLREALRLNEEQCKHLASLKTGECIVFLHRIGHPVLVRVEASLELDER